MNLKVNPVLPNNEDALSALLVSEYFAYNVLNNEDKKLFFQSGQFMRIRDSMSLLPPKKMHSSGTSGVIKRYLFGGGFNSWYDFYNRLFFWNRPFITMIASSHRKSHMIHAGKSHVNILIKSRSDKLDLPQRPLENVHVKCNLENLFMLESICGEGIVEKIISPYNCVLNNTYSSLRDTDRKYFEKRGFAISNHMKCWDGGACFITCKYDNTHWIDFSSMLNFKDNKVVSTDPWNTAQCFKSYWNGDMVHTVRTGMICDCGLPIDFIRFEERSLFIEFNGMIFDHIFFRSMANDHAKLRFNYISVAIENDKIFIIGDFAKNSTPDNVVFDIQKSYNLYGKIEFARVSDEFFLSNKTKRVFKDSSWRNISPIVDTL